MNSTREMIVIERKATNKPPYKHITANRSVWFDESQRIKGNRKQLLEQARQLAKG